MTIYYRLCNIKSPLSAKPPIFQDDIYSLNKLCLDSFVMAYLDVNPKVVFICDYCPKERYEPLLESVPFEKEIIFTELGINDTCLMQYEMAKEVKDDVILFNEGDHLWLPQSGKKMESAIKHFGLISGYDHLNFYVDRTIHSKKAELELFEDHHFRTVERNVMTFGMTKEAFMKNFDSLYRWGYLDNDVWKEMRVNGYPLWTALPAFETHMAKDWLAPSIDWKQLWEILSG